MTARPSYHARGFTEDLNGYEIPIVTVSSSSPYERGVQYGAQAREQIEVSIEHYARLFEFSSGASWSDITERALAWDGIIEGFDADIVQELHGLAEGSGRSLGDILALNARSELVYSVLFPADGCTAFALLGADSVGGHTFAGQNWDWQIGTKRSRVYLHIHQPPKPTVTMLVEAGQMGRHGANSAGIALFANGLPSQGTGAPGVPHGIIRRKVLDQRLFSQATDLLLRTSPQVPANVLLAHDEFAIDMEMTTDERRWGAPQDGVLTHANHYEFFVGREYSSLTPDSPFRRYFMERGLRRAAEQADADATRRAIADTLAHGFGHPNSISRHQDPADPPLLRWETLSSSIVDLTSGSWYTCDGAPDERVYRTLPWNIYDEQT